MSYSYFPPNSSKHEILNWNTMTRSHTISVLTGSFILKQGCGQQGAFIKGWSQKEVDLVSIYLFQALLVRHEACLNWEGYPGNPGGTGKQSRLPAGRVECKNAACAFCSSNTLALIPCQHLNYIVLIGFSTWKRFLSRMRNQQYCVVQLVSS